MHLLPGVPTWTRVVDQGVGVDGEPHGVLIGREQPGKVAGGRPHRC